MGIILTTFARFIRGRLFPPSDPITSLKGKTVLLTGGSSGIGLEAAIKYINLGASSLIIGCRNAERGNEAKKIIEARTSSSQPGSVQIWPLDMNSFQSVKTFAERVNNEVPRLDIALLNAGVVRRYYTVSVDGWQETIQVNALSNALLGLLLLPKLRASRDPQTGLPAHLTFVSSGSFRLAKPEQLRPKGEGDGNDSSSAKSATESSILEHLNKEENFRSQPQYSVAKALLEYVVKNIANLTRRDDGTLDVIVNSACPALCRSGLSREFSAFYERFARWVFYGIFGRTPEQGSRSLVSATMLGDESHGKFWRDDEYPDTSYTLTGTEEGRKLQQQAWREIVEELKRQSPEVEQIVSS